MSKKYLVWLEPAKSGEGGPVDPGYGVEGPGEGGGGHPVPVPPIELPGLPDIPVQPLPPTEPPVVEGGNKPAGIPTVPMDPNWKPPTSAPHPPGDWVTIDAGRGQPPAWAFIPDDDGLGETPTPKPAAGGPAGHWVPLGKEKTADPVWAYVPEIGPQYGLKPPVAQPK